MWCDFQDSQSMGLQGTTCKRKLECDSASPSKMSRVDDWMSDQYLPSGNTRYQYYSGYSSPAPSEERPTPCYQPQQTIRRDENGKSYLELGSYSTTSGKCCEGRTNWCARGPSCYRQRRLAVLNISMCKLGRYRQYSDPSLHRSVLICNTLRLIEREMEQEGYFSASQSHAPAAEPTHQQFPEVPHPYEPPRVATPFPSAADDTLSINWGSVLSLSSQSDLDPLNNNDSDPELEDFLPSWKVTPDDIMRRSSDSSELDSIMHVLVGT